MTAIDPLAAGRDGGSTNDDDGAPGPDFDMVDSDFYDSDDGVDPALSAEETWADDTEGFWPERRWQPPRWTHRGLLVGATVVLILLAVTLLRPPPAGRLENTTEAVRPEPTAGVASTTSSTAAAGQAISQGISAKEATNAGAATTEVGEAAAGASSAFPAVAVPNQGDVHDVANPAQWTAALAAARPGDVIRLTANIGQPLQYRGVHFQPEKAKGADGTAEAPITITAADGVWIDPGNKNNNKPGLDVLYTRHVNVVGLRVRNSQFGIRVLGSVGTAEAPVLVANNTVTDVGHAAIHIGANFDNREPSRFIRVQDNVVTRAGQTAPEFGEGIYLGYGRTEWIDKSSDIEVVGNEISFVGAEGVDIKPGVKRVLVENNDIHDLSPLRGGAISATYVSTTNNPNPGVPAEIMVRGNRIWNLNLDGRAGSNDWAIWVGHGGVTVADNTVWGLRNNPSQARAVRVRSPYDFGPHPIRIVDNTFWTATGWLAEGEPNPAGLISASGNKGPGNANGIEVPIPQPSGAPALGSSGPADAGQGPGSAFGAP